MPTQKLKISVSVRSLAANHIFTELFIRSLFDTKGASFTTLDGRGSFTI
jgi:hypothetical protein